MMNRYFWDGSYTVEAAFVVPLILGIVYAWMFQLFFLHDQVVMAGMLQEIVIREQEMTEQGKTIDAQTKREWQRTIQTQLWTASIRRMSLKEGKIQTTGKIRMEAAWDIPVMEYFLGNHFKSDMVQKLPVVHPETVLRIKDEEGHKD